MGVRNGDIDVAIEGTEYQEEVPTQRDWAMTLFTWGLVVFGILLWAPDVIGWTVVGELPSATLNGYAIGLSLAGLFPVYGAGLRRNLVWAAIKSTLISGAFVLGEMLSPGMLWGQLLMRIGITLVAGLVVTVLLSRFRKRIIGV